MSQASKRVVPPALRKILDADVFYTNKFVLLSNKFIPFNNYKKYYKGLEISCHGIPWFAFWICFTWLFNDVSLIPMQVNMILGLFIDILFIAIIKAYTRRKRPQSNKDDALGTIGPDVFSFPSGHASRAVFVAYFFINLFPSSIFYIPFILIWSISICISRLLLNRHHILDVIGGVILGLFEGWLLGLILIEGDTAKFLMNYLSDEKSDGGEYHV